MRAVRKEADGYKGEYRGQAYPINDDKAGYYFEVWKSSTPDEVVSKALKDTALWGADLTELKGFEAAVREDLHALINQGATATLARKSNTARL
jgi:tagaturonate reductase